MSVTKKNHYIPCLWTAFWNYKYFNDKTYRESNEARQQHIYSLNLGGNKIISTTVENVFFEKKMGLAEINYDSFLEYTMWNHPDSYDEILKAPKQHYDDLLIDFENFFTIMDEIIAEPLERIILNNKFTTITDKTHISCFIFDLRFRNYQIFNELVTMSEKRKIPKFEFFVNIRNNFSNPEYLKHLIIPIIASEWILYQSSEFIFPLSDIPVLINKKNILIALSPKLLLKINFKKKVKPEALCRLKEKVNRYIYNDYIKRMLKSFNREIIFYDKTILEKIQKSNLYLKRKRMLTTAHRPARGSLI